MALGTAVVVMAAIVAWPLAGRLAGVVTGGLAAVYPPLLFNDGPPLSEPLGLLLLFEVELDAALRRHAVASLRDDPLQVVDVVRGQPAGVLGAPASRNRAPESADGRNRRLGLQA